MKKIIASKRSGNMMLVMVVSTCIIIASLATHLQTSHTLSYANTISKEHQVELSAKAATEIGVYQFTKELCSVVATKSDASQWISRTTASVYTDALDLILTKVIDNENRWLNTDLYGIVASSGFGTLEDATALSEVVEGSSFELKLAEAITFDWRNEGNFETDDKSLIALDPILIETTYKKHGVELKDVFEVSGLYLSVVQQDATMSCRIIEGDENNGITILRKVD